MRALSGLVCALGRTTSEFLRAQFKRPEHSNLYDGLRCDTLFHTVGLRILQQQLGQTPYRQTQK